MYGVHVCMHLCMACMCNNCSAFREIQAQLLPDIHPP